MADIAYAPTPLKAFGDNNCHSILWETITSANEKGLKCEMPGSSDRSVQFFGTWGTATAILQGSNDGATWFTLHDPLGNNISFTADGLKQIMEITRYIRPFTSGGNGAQDIDCIVIMKQVR